MADINSEQFSEQLIEVDPESVSCDWQARGSVGSGDLSPASIIDLVSSIERCGQLHPCRVYAGDDGGYHLIVGERRLRAFKWARSQGRPGFERLKVLVVNKPSGPDARREQLAENLARSALSDGDLAQALMYARCGLLEEYLIENGAPPDMSLLPESDAVSLWKQLAKAARKSGTKTPGWGDVISDLGLGITQSKAERVVAAFRRLPKEVSDELDAKQVSTLARTRVSKWWPEASGYVEAGMEIEEAIEKAIDLAGASAGQGTPGEDRTEDKNIGAGSSSSNAGNDPEGWNVFEDPPGGGIFDEAEDVHLPDMDPERFCPQALVDELLTAARKVAEDGGGLNEYDLNSLRVLFGQIFNNSS